jgi:hypothetical protein
VVGPEAEVVAASEAAAAGTEAIAAGMEAIAAGMEAIAAAVPDPASKSPQIGPWQHMAESLTGGIGVCANSCIAYILGVLGGPFSFQEIISGREALGTWH